MTFRARNTGAMAAVIAIGLSACTGNDEAARQRALSPNEIGVYGNPTGETATTLGQAGEEAGQSPTAREIDRRYSADAARGNKPLWKSVPTSLPDLTRWNTQLTEMPAPFPTQDASASALSFDDAIRAAMIHSIEAAQASETLSKAEIAAGNAAFGYLPRVSAVGEFSRVSQNVIDTDNAVFQAGRADFNVLNGRVEATQALIDFGALMAIRVADTAKSAAERAYVSAVQTASFEAATAYLLALEAKARLDSIETRIALLSEQAAAESRLIQSGLSTPAARQLIEVQIGQTEIERLEYSEDYDNAIVQLGKLVGQPIGDLADVRVEPRLILQLGQGDADELVRAAIRDNPQMQQLRLETLRQRQEFRRQVAEDFAPTAEFFARAEYEDRDNSRFGGGSVTFDGTVGVRVDVPIFNATGNGYQSFESQSDLRFATLSEANLRRALETEVRSLVTRLERQRALMAKAREAIKASEGLLAAARDSVASGLATDLLVLRQKLQLARAREWQKRANYAYLRNLVRLSFLTGKRIDLN